ncbi:MAG: ankyrin repeat domain-containing protein [Acidobacteria bacterium]|nr:ankyrin repeat domain-containing protein [Acidobacteriota bacterium]
MHKIWAICLLFLCFIGCLLADADKDLIKAAEKGDLKKIRKALDAGADVYFTAYHGWTALHAICAVAGTPQNLEHSPEIVRLLIENGADVNATALKGTMPLMYAAQSGNLIVIKMLLDHGAEVNAQTENGATALMAAAAYGQLPAARLLVAHGADYTMEDEKGRTAYSYAATTQGWREGLAVSLMDRGAERAEVAAYLYSLKVEDLNIPPTVLVKTLDFKCKMTDRDDVFTRFSWIMKLQNCANQTIEISALIKFVDAEGFILDQDTVLDIRLARDEIREFTGYHLVKSSLALQVADVKVEIKQ